LKHAGGFRLIRNEKVANSIIAYDQFNNNAVEGIATFHYSLYNDAVRLRNKVFAQAVINKISDRYHAGLIPPSADPWIDSMIVANRVPLKTEDLNALMFEFKNAILAYRQDYGNMKWGYGNLRDRQKGLIELINKEYHLE
jgi:hypothetical protein